MRALQAVSDRWSDRSGRGHRLHTPAIAAVREPDEEALHDERFQREQRVPLRHVQERGGRVGRER
jgi:hypothetical protein